MCKPIRDQWVRQRTNVVSILSAPYPFCGDSFCFIDARRMSRSLDIPRATSERCIRPNSDSHVYGVRGWLADRTLIEPSRSSFVEAQIRTIFSRDSNDNTGRLTEQNCSTNPSVESMVNVGHKAGYPCDEPSPDQASDYKPYPMRDWYQGLLFTAIITLFCLTAVAVGILPDEKATFAPSSQVESNNDNSVNRRELAKFDNYNRTENDNHTRGYTEAGEWVDSDVMRRVVECSTTIYLGDNGQPTTRETNTISPSYTGIYECVQVTLSLQGRTCPGCVPEETDWISVGTNTITLTSSTQIPTKVAPTAQEPSSADDDSVPTGIPTTPVPVTTTTSSNPIPITSSTSRPHFSGDIPSDYVTVGTNTITLAPTEDMPTNVATTTQGLSSPGHRAAEDPQATDMQLADQGTETNRGSEAAATASDNALSISPAVDVGTNEVNIGGFMATVTGDTQTTMINGSPTTIAGSVWTTMISGSLASITGGVRTTVISGLTATITGGVLTAVVDGSLTTIVDVSQGLSTYLVDALVRSTYTTVTTNADGTPTTQLVYVADALTTTSMGSQGFQTRTGLTLVTDLPTASSLRSSDSSLSSAATLDPNPAASGSPTDSNDRPETPTLQVYVVTEGQYFVGLFLPTLLSTFLAIPLRIIDFNVKLYRPFHYLLSHDGTDASRSLLLPTTGLSSYFRASDRVTRLTGGLIVLSSILIPISTEAVHMVLHRGDGCHTGGGKAKNCAITLGFSAVPAYATIFLLSLMGALTISTWLHLRNYRTGVPGKPWNLEFMSSFSSDPRIQSLVSELTANSVPLERKDIIRVLDPWLYIIEIRAKASGGCKVVIFDKSHSQENRGTKNIIYQEKMNENKFQPGNSRAAPSFILTAYGRILISLFITGILGLIVAYERNRPGNGFEDFMDSENIGVRFLFSGVGVALTLIWAAFFQGKLYMSLDRSPSSRVMLTLLNRHRLRQPI
jgi:hypothetical protein